MSAERLRVAVVGAGHVGKMHIRVVGECDATTLSAVVDPDPGAETSAYAARARWFRSVDELLGEEPPDAAIVAVPTEEHRAVAEPLLRAGIPVLVEKPIAESVDAANSLIEAAREGGAALAVGHVERFNPAVQALQEKLDGGALGRVFQIRTTRLSPFPIRVGDAGVAMDLATHDLDLMCELAGRPLRVSAESDRKAHRSHEDLLAALLRFDSGIIGLLEVNWLTPDKVRQLTVTGERGMFIVDYLNQHLTLYENAQATEAWETIAIFEGVTEGNVTRFAISRTEPLRAQLDAFVSAVRGDAPVVVTGDDGVRAVRLALAAAEAGRTGRGVEIDDDAAGSDSG
ncbi:MAG: Gfo/Idh/MocA family oxidoreductase [Actinomycetota bacterium]